MCASFSDPRLTSSCRWARAGLEGNEEAATTLMREAATPGRRPRLHEIAWCVTLFISLHLSCLIRCPRRSVRTEAEDGLPHSSRAADAAPPPSTTASPRLWRPSSVAAADYAINSAAAAAAASRAAARSEGPTLLRSNTPKRLEFRRVLSQPAPRVVPVAGASTAGAGGGSGDDAVAADVECMPQRDVGLRSGADFARAVAAFRDTL